MSDPRVVLGLGPDATLAEARAARRRLAKELHPDVHTGRSDTERAESGRRMTEVNLALAEFEAAARPARAPGEPPGPSPPGPQPPGPPPAGRQSGREDDHPHPPSAVIDSDSFAVAALPAEAFEALFLVAYGLGDILVADEPYELEVYLADPPACFCQLHIVPEAGGSIITIDVSPAEGAELPAADVVRDLLVDELNGLAAMGPT